VKKAIATSYCCLFFSLSFFYFIHLHYFCNHLLHRLWCSYLCRRIFGSFCRRS
jgi:hypothetical protein